MNPILHSCKTFCVAGVVLLCCPPVGAQVERLRTDSKIFTQPKAAETMPTAVGAQVDRPVHRTDSKLYTQPKSAEKSPAAVAQVERPLPRTDPRIFTQPKPAEKNPPAVGIEERRRFQDAVEVRPLRVEPCDLVTRDELEAILKSSDTNRALVAMPKGPSWQYDRKKVDCSYGVRYETRIFPDQGNDNAVIITIDFDDKYAKQGKLIVDRPVVYGYPMALEIVNGLGDEAVYLLDVSRFKHEEKYKSTAGANPYQYYDKQDFLVVRRKAIVFKFRITKTVAGNTGSDNLIQIARKALVRVQ
jgi:hypothetical protein